MWGGWEDNLTVLSVDGVGVGRHVAGPEATEASVEDAVHWHLGQLGVLDGVDDCTVWVGAPDGRAALAVDVVQLTAWRHVALGVAGAPAVG